MKKILLIAILILFNVAAVSDLACAEDSSDMIESKGMSRSETELRSAMRGLWATRATLLRGYIVSAMNDSEDADEAKGKLLDNAADLGASIRPYYGYWAKSILTGLLKKDVMLTGGVIKAAKLGDKDGLEWAKNIWYVNALAVAGFFAITHNQTMQDLTDMFNKHLDLTWGEIDAILKKDKAKDLEYFEKDKAHMLMVSDVLVDGLIKQMPKRFR